MTQAHEAHCRRVAAIAGELTRRLDLPAEAVRQASFGHDLRPQGMARLLEDLHVQASGGQAEAGCAAPPGSREAKIVEVAHAFDQAWEFAPYEPRSHADVLAEMETLGMGGAPLEALRSLALSPLPAPPELAAYPAALSRALAWLRADDVSLDRIEAAVRSDQVLTAGLLAVANSALCGPAAPIRTVGRAIGHIGTEAARRVVLAAGARPLFASARLAGLWRHSLNVAAIAERLAAATRKADPEEAFVAGLIHDIGRLAAESLPRFAAETHARIAAEGGCVTLADFAVLGRDHGDYGAQVLAGLPADLTEAVRYHHRPEETTAVLPKLLYLAEFVSESDEDLPSAARLGEALAAVGLRTVMDVLEKAAVDRRRMPVLALAG